MGLTQQEIKAAAEKLAAEKKAKEIREAEEKAQAEKDAAAAQAPSASVPNVNTDAARKRVEELQAGYKKESMYDRELAAAAKRQKAEKAGAAHRQRVQEKP